MPMFFTYRRVGRLPLLPALAAGAVLAAVAGVAAITVGAVVVVAGSVRLLRAIGRLGAGEPAVRVPDTDIIEGVVVDSTDLPLSNTEQLRRPGDVIVVPRREDPLAVEK